MYVRCKEMLNESEPRLQWAPEPKSNPTPSKREVKKRSNKAGRKRYGWRNTNNRKFPVISVML